MTVPDGYTLLRAVDYSALQNIAGPALAWAEAERAMKESDAKAPTSKYRGDWSAAHRRWMKTHKPLMERERITRKALLEACRAALPDSPPRPSDDA